MREPILIEKHWIADRHWTVKWYDYPPDDLPPDPDRKGHELAGYCDIWNTTIHVYDGDWQTFLHELLEAIKASGSLPLPHWVLVQIEVGLSGWVRGNGILE